MTEFMGIDPNSPEGIQMVEQQFSMLQLPMNTVIGLSTGIKIGGAQSAFRTFNSRNFRHTMCYHNHIPHSLVV